MNAVAGASSAPPFCERSCHVFGTCRIPRNRASMLTRRSPYRSGRSSPNTPRSSSHCRSTRPISTSRKTSRASYRRRKSRKKSVQGIRAEIELTASAGVSYNKFLAKLASDHRKPDGLFVITPKMGPSFVETLPVRKFHVIGPATAKKMARLGIETGLDLKGQTLEFLQQHFGKAGSYYYWAARGVDERLVRADRIRKSA